MRTNRLVDVIESHTEGQVVRTVTGGIDTSRIEGDSVASMVESFDEEFGWLIDFLAKEPRGHGNLVVTVPVEPAADEADIGYLFFDHTGHMTNCGDGIISATTALVETGILDVSGSVTIEVPAGLVETEVRLGADGAVEEIGIQGMESYTYAETTATIATDDGERTVPVDVAYGGNWFAFADATDLDLPIDQASADPDRISDYGVQIRDAVNERIDVVDPLTDESAQVTMTILTDRSADVDRGLLVYAADSIGRSPCGTGTAAQLARLYAAGELDVDEPHPIDSPLDTQFTGRILDVEQRGETTVTICEVAGSAKIIAKNTYLQDPGDDLDGFVF